MKRISVIVCATWMAVAAQELPPRVQLPPTAFGNGSIAGRVVVAGTSPAMPIRRARVTLRAATLSDPRVTDSDTSGYYRFENLPSGAYHVSAEKPGYVTLEHGARRAFATPPPIDLVNGRSIEADIHLPPGAAIEGRIVNDRGDPVMNFPVVAMQLVPAPNGRRPRVVRQTATNDLGRYRLHSLPAGEYYVSVSGDPLAPNALVSTAPRGFARTYFPGTPRVDEARTLALKTGDEATGVDFAIATVPVARITVRVVDAAGKPAALSAVRIQPASGALADVRAIGDPRNRDTWMLPAVAPGEYWMLATAMPMPNADPEFSVTRLSVSGEDRQITVNTERGTRIDGRVEFDTDGTAPAAPALRVVAHATEYELPIPPGGNDRVFSPGPVGADARFTIASLFGPRILRLDRLPPTWALEAVWLDTTDITDSVTDFRASNATRPLRIVVTDRTGTVTGTMSGAQPGAEGDQRAVLFADEERLWTPLSRFVRVAAPAADGRFTIPGVLPGKYVICAVDAIDDDTWTDPAVLRRLRTIGSSIAVTAGNTETITLTVKARAVMRMLVLVVLALGGPQAATIQPPAQLAPAGLISGRITAAVTGDPVAGAQVRLVSERGPQHLTTADAQGRYEFAGLPPGRYRVSVTADGFLNMELGQPQPLEPGTPIDLKEGERFTSAHLSLARAAAIEGRVLDEFGDPAPNITMQVSTLEYAASRRRLSPVPSRVRPQPTDDKGRFRIFGLAPGEYYLTALSGVFTDQNETGGFAPTYFPGVTAAAAAKPIRVANRDVTNITFALAPARMARVSGTVTDASGRPVPNASMWIAQNDADGAIDFTLARGSADRDGRFTFRNVPPGRFNVQAFGAPEGGGNLGRAPFGWLPIVTNGEDLSALAITVTPGAAARGRIVLEGDAPQPAPRDVIVSPRPVEFTSSPIGGGPPPSVTRDDWTFEVEKQFGLRVIRVNVRDPAWTLKRVTVNGKDVTDDPVDFRKDDVNGIEVTLTSRAASVTGTVIDRNQRTVSACTIVIFAADRARWAYPSRFIAIGRPNQEGRFTIKGLPPEDYRIIAVRAAGNLESQDPEFLEKLWYAAKPLTLGEGDVRTLDLSLVDTIR